MHIGTSVAAASIFALLFSTPSRAAVPDKQSNAGDSISQAFAANGKFGDKEELSWVQGTDPSVNSLFLRYQSLNPNFTQEPESVTGAEMVSGDNSFAAQAARICSQKSKPQLVSVLLGGNDVCGMNRSSTDDAAANLHSVETWTAALTAGMDQLAACLPEGASVHLLSVPRVDYLYSAGIAKGKRCTWGAWPTLRLCTIITSEKKAERRAQIGARINQYNDAILEQAAIYATNKNGKNSRGIVFFTDWKGSIEQGQANTSIGTFPFEGGDLSNFDCFHPNVQGQKKIACSVWANSPEGDGNSRTCLAGSKHLGNGSDP